MIIGIVIAVLAATGIGWLSVRTEGIYMIMITLAIGVAFYYLARRTTPSSTASRASSRCSRRPWRASPGAIPRPSTTWPWSVRWRATSPWSTCCARPSGSPSRASATIRAHARARLHVTAHRVAAYAVAGALAAVGGVLFTWYNGLVTRAGGHGLAHQLSRHRGARWPAASGRRLPGRDRLRAPAELRHRRHSPRALQSGDRCGVPRHRAVLARRSARLVGGPERPDVNSRGGSPWTAARKRSYARSSS